MHDHKQVLKHRKLSQQSDGPFFCTHHHAPQISTFLEPSKMPSFGNGLGVITLLKKRKSGCEYTIKTGTRREQMLFLAGKSLLKLMQII
jgi:hypothetical protein